MRCKCDMPPGKTACHCRACCATFSGITAFDHHILNGEHCEPSGRGLVPNPRGEWSWPAKSNPWSTKGHVRGNE